jgi:hypothetical protein
MSATFQDIINSETSWPGQSMPFDGVGNESTYDPDAAAIRSPAIGWKCTSSPTANLVVMAGPIHPAPFFDLKIGGSLIVNPMPATSNAVQIAVCVFAYGRAVKPFSIFQRLRSDSPHSLDNCARVHPNKPRAACTSAPKVARPRSFHMHS